MNAHTQRARGIAEAEAARAELYDTLSQLKVQLNYAKRIDDAVDDTKRRIVDVKRRSPLAFVAGVAGAAVIAGAVVWAAAAAVMNRIDD